MRENIEIWGIETNNLKNIDVSLQKHAINLIIGPSGSGKSSLAYDTIAQIGQHEFMAMFADNISEPSYRVKGYKGLTAAVPIKQSNYNNNMRSTIGTYFGINQSIALIYANCLGLSESFFTLNKDGNICGTCHGLGTIDVLDENRVIDYDTPLRNNPIKCWNRYKDFYSQIIQQFCSDAGIDSTKNFRQLSKKEKELFLHGESSVKYTVRYKKNSSFSRRTTKYHGILSMVPMMPNYTPPIQFYSEVKCPCCAGKRFAPAYDEYRLDGISIGEFMILPFSQLLTHIESIRPTVESVGLSFTLETVKAFLEKSIELNLGHLYFNRSIPTLSGGELQRLRMVQVFNTQLTDLLIVLDEPLAGLSGDEQKSILQNIVALSERHTIVLVDHSELFVPEAKTITALGMRGGRDGGRIIDTTEYLHDQQQKKDVKIVFPKSNLHIHLENSVYEYRGVDVSVGYECLNLISGKSGIGKSTLLREYLPQYFEQYTYINQKPLLGNKRSSVATVLNIYNQILEMFASAYKKDKHFFSNQTGCEGACSGCGGSGYLEYGYTQGLHTRLECRDCEGTGFNVKLKKYLLAGKSIFDIWNMTIDDAIVFFKPLSKKIAATLEEGTSIMLGHLRIGQPTGTLSGGENIRIKILKSAHSSSKTLGIDEPFKGLNASEIYSVFQYLDYLRSKGKTVIVVDHTEAASQYFATHIELKNDNGILTGI